MPRARQDSEAVDVDHGHFVGRHLNRFPVVMSLDKRAPGGRWAPSAIDRATLRGSHPTLVARVAKVR